MTDTKSTLSHKRDIDSLGTMATNDDESHKKQEQEIFFETSTSAGTTFKVRFPSNDEGARFAVGYWSIRGLAAPLRMMLCAAKVNFDAFQYDLLEQGDDGWSSEYFTEKPTLRERYHQPLMNLPYIVDRKERAVVCQTNACFSYLAREIGMWGESSLDISKCEELLCEIYDIRNIMTGFAYGTPVAERETAGRDAVKKAKGSFKKIETILSSSSDPHYLVGGKATAPDFHLFEMLDQYEDLCKDVSAGDLYERFPCLKAFKINFESLSENQLYLKSQMHTQTPINNCMAVFGSAPGRPLYKRGQAAPWMNQGDIALSP